MIYFARHIERNIIKIGCSVSVGHRLQELSCRHGAMELLGMMQGSYDEEQQLHWQFEAFNVRFGVLWGVEWYFPAQSIFNYIETNATVIDNSFGMEFARWYAGSRQRKFLSMLPALLLKKYGVETPDQLPHNKIIAKQIGIDPQVLFDWLRKGYVRRPRPNTVECIVNFLGCSVGDLLEYVPGVEPERELA